MFKLNKKGQASSTFQLLIAAIVALAILGVLISVIGGIGGISGDPATATKQLVRSQINNPGAVVCTDPVEFSKTKTPELSASGITKDSGLDRGQVYFTTPTDAISGFPVPEDPKILTYNSNSKKKVVMCVLCDEHTDSDSPVESRISTLGLESVEIDSSNVGQTVCIVFPKKTA
jgi:hypothetical protein